MTRHQRHKSCDLSATSYPGWYCFFEGLHANIRSWHALRHRCGSRANYMGGARFLQDNSSRLNWQLTWCMTRLGTISAEVCARVESFLLSSGLVIQSVSCPAAACSPLLLWSMTRYSSHLNRDQASLGGQPAKVPDLCKSLTGPLSCA